MSPDLFALHTEKTTNKTTYQLNNYYIPVVHYIVHKKIYRMIQNLKRHNFDKIVHIINWQIIFWQMPTSTKHLKL